MEKLLGIVFRVKIHIKHDFFTLATKYGSFGDYYDKKIMFDVYFDSKYYSEQLSHSMSVPNIARLAVAMVKKSCLMCILTVNTIPSNFSIVCLYQIWPV